MPFKQGAHVRTQFSRRGHFAERLRPVELPNHERNQIRRQMVESSQSGQQAVEKTVGNIGLLHRQCAVVFAGIEKNLSGMGRLGIGDHSPNEMIQCVRENVRTFFVARPATEHQADTHTATGALIAGCGS